MDEESRTGGRGEPSTHDEGTAGVNQLAARFSEIARLLQAEDDTDTMLDELVASAVRMIPGAQDGSISVVTGRTEVTSEHPTSDFPARMDEIQTEERQGPCLDAAYEHETVRVPDMTREERWPRFARRAAEAGTGSMLSFQLYVEHDDLGALNLYSREPNAFDDESEQVGLLFASHAAVAFADARKLDQLSRAAGSRDLIGQAKGILMERYGLDEQQAFRVLTRVSQNSHRKLHDVAQELATTRRLPGLPAAQDPGR
ncbi:GAF and ANTAR domain-containing protein [Microlunatus flavus]|uniref:GAF domain-containing protein n=1 Tax=Microlunatus flavus TaxID=1036181 RepID=A0A1H9MR06_9ACTN|nr:GAF and ANTAR domain-containing protein [Microlunatus flavus]SER26146.1 GAF domain-containing protein [Microlunatus flavus]